MTLLEKNPVLRDMVESRCSGRGAGIRGTAPLAHELLFESHRIDFTRPGKEQILREIGMTPKSVTEMLEQVDRDQQDQ